MQRNQAVDRIVLCAMATMAMFVQINEKLRSVKCDQGRAPDGGVLQFVSFSLDL
jgi:hypothetical protein